MSWKNKIAYTGVWIQPVMMLLLLKSWFWYRPRDDITFNAYMVFFFLSCMPTVYVYSKNLIAYRNGKRNFGMLDAFAASTRPEYQPTMKYKAMYPMVNQKLLDKKPKGIVFGKYKGKYVCRDVYEDGHVFLIGGSGSGKSSCLVIPTLLSNPKARIFALDIKGELSFKSTKLGSDDVLIFNPNNRQQCGYNPFFALYEGCSNQLIVETMQSIAISLIPLLASVKEPFWNQSARNLLTGLLIYYYKQGITNFIQIVDEILGRPIDTAIAEIVESTEANSAEYRYLNQFVNLADVTLGGIVSEMNNHLVIFSNDQNIRYAFRENGNKINPRMLEEGYSIYLAIKEEKLSAYYDVLQLILNQTLSELEKRPENSEPIIFVIDELPRILSAGKIEKLLDGARTLRSRKVILFLISQSLEAIMTAYSENEVYDLVSNCPYIIVLSATSPKTQQAICKWCGTYNEKVQNVSLGTKQRSMSVSYQKKDIVDPADLMTLANTGEAILISPYGYNRIKKTPYFKDKTFKSQATQIVKYNQIIMEGITDEK